MLTILDSERLLIFESKYFEAAHASVRRVQIPQCTHDMSLSRRKAMQAALKELRTTQDLEKIVSMSVSLVRFNEIVGHTAWRRLELKTLSDAAPRKNTDPLILRK